MKLATVADVTEAISKLLAEPRKEKPSKLMLEALDAVVSQIESRSRGSETINQAMTKVREACGIAKPTEKADSLNGGS